MRSLHLVIFRGLFHPMGALLYSNQTYRETLPVIDASGVSSFAFGYTSPEWLYDWRNGYTEEVSTPLSELTANELFKEEIERYTTFWNTEFAPKAVIGYKARGTLSECIIDPDDSAALVCRMVLKGTPCRLWIGSSRMTILFCCCSSSTGWCPMAMGT